MKREELMMGDWVLLDYNWSEDDPMYTQLDYRPYQIERGEDIDLAEETNCIGDADVYQPINLTKEILEKIGFEVRENDTAVYKKLNDDKSDFDEFVLIDFEKPSLCRVEKYTRPRAKFEGTITAVHELQHSLNLCGIKIDFNLYEKQGK